jgi:hypothetical protein
MDISFKFHAAANATATVMATSTIPPTTTTKGQKI